jgi:hypothetical protein
VTPRPHGRGLPATTAASGDPWPSGPSCRNCVRCRGPPSCHSSSSIYDSFARLCQTQTWSHPHHSASPCSNLPLAAASSSSSPRPSIALRRPVISSIDMVETSSKDSIEMTTKANLFGTTHKHFRATLRGSSRSPRISSLWTILTRHRAKSSRDSPPRKAMFSYYLRMRCADEMPAQSEPGHDDSS